MRLQIQLLLSLIFLMFINIVNAQQIDETEQKKKNPIIYAEMFGGGIVMNQAGLGGGFELNYQYKKNLFSFRYTNVVGYIEEEYKRAFLFPRVYVAEDNLEYAFLYGRRWMNHHRSFSISTGISCNNMDIRRRIYVETNNEEGQTYKYTYNSNYETFYGVPFEANFKWFYPKKKSRLIYNALIPSIGLKVFGNISKHTYAGVGLSIGFGLSREY